MRKIDMFTASKDLSARVEDFQKSHTWRAILSKRHSNFMKEYNSKVSAIDDMEEKGIIAPDKAVEMLDKLESERNQFESDYAECQERYAAFKWLPEDNQAYKKYVELFHAENYTTGEAIALVVSNWGKTWGLEMKDTDLLWDCVAALSGVDANGNKGILSSDGTVWTKERGKAAFMKVLYGTFAEKMIAVGTLKPRQIPADVRGGGKNEK